MLKDITIGRYIETDSFLHRLDARSKILGTVLFSVTALSCSDAAGFALLSAVIVFAAAISHLPVKYILKGIKPLRWLILFTIILNIFTAEGNIIWQWKALHITYEGIIFAAVTALRLILFVTGTSLLTLTTSPVSLTDGLARLMKPLKKIRVPVDDIAMIISITLRFIPIFADETEHIMKAQRSRGADFGSGGLMSKIRSIIPVIVPLFLSVFRKAEELSLAMDSRCYGKGTRNMRKKTHMGENDLIFGVFLVIICGFLIIFEFYH